MSRSSSFNQGSLTHVEVATLSDTTDQHIVGGESRPLFFSCDAGDVVKVTELSGHTSVYTAKNDGWQPYAVLRVWSTGSTIADTATFQIGW